MARGCTCALFSSGPAFLKIFPAAAALGRFKSPGRSRRFTRVVGIAPRAKQSKNSLSRHSRQTRETGIISTSSIFYTREPRQTMHLTSIVATLLSRIKHGETTFVSFITSKCGVGWRARRGCFMITSAARSVRRLRLNAKAREEKKEKKKKK